MRHHLFAGLAAVLIAAGLVVAAPTASAGCLYDGGLSSSRCDGTVQPDGTWQRCVTWNSPSTDSGYPPTHIDD